MRMQSILSAVLLAALCAASVVHAQQKKPGEPVEPAKAGPATATYTFTKQAEIEKEWSITGDKWSLQNGGMLFKARTILVSKKRYVGDFSIQIAFNKVIKIWVCGEEFATLGTAVKIERKGDALTFSSNEGPSSGKITIKDAALNEPTELKMSFFYKDDTSKPGPTLRSVKITGTVASDP